MIKHVDPNMYCKIRNGFIRNDLIEESTELAVVYIAVETMSFVAHIKNNIGLIQILIQ